MQISFRGAAGEVTGSLHELNTRRLRLLLDCGAFQGSAVTVAIRNRSTVEDAESVDGVVLSHGHLDHCGRLPQLYRDGFRGPIFCTPATADVAAVMLHDAARIAAERVPDDVPPAFTVDDVRAVEALLEPLQPGQWHRLSSDLSVRFSQAGHILGAAVCELKVRDAGEDRRVVYAADLGRRGLPLVPDPAPVPGCDVLLVEATYADAVHASVEELAERLCDIVQQTVQRGGRVIVPAFSIGRTQLLAWLLNELIATDRVPAVPIFIDSPLAHRITALYRRHAEAVRSERRHLFQRDPEEAFPNVQCIRRRIDSIALNDVDQPCVIIAGGGMCEGGRVLYHLRQALEDERNTVLLVSYQAPETLGRKLAAAASSVRIFDRVCRVRATVHQLHGLSAHADALDFKWWFEGLADEGGIGQAFIVHGEPQAAQTQAQLLQPYCDEDPIVPQHGETWDV